MSARRSNKIANRSTKVDYLLYQVSVLFETQPERLQMIEERSAGALIFYEDPSGNRERLFLSLHYPAGHWDFPKGAVEKNETEEQAAKREIMEETGLRIDSFVPGFRKTIEYHYRRSEGLSHKQVIFFLARSPKKEVKISFEHSGFEWLTFDQSLKRLTFENARNILREARTFLAQQNSKGSGT